MTMTHFNQSNHQILTENNDKGGEGRTGIYVSPEDCSQPVKLIQISVIGKTLVQFK